MGETPRVGMSCAPPPQEVAGCCEEVEGPSRKEGHVSVSPAMAWHPGEPLHWAEWEQVLVGTQVLLSSGHRYLCMPCPVPLRAQLCASPSAGDPDTLLPAHSSWQ